MLECSWFIKAHLSFKNEVTNDILPEKWRGAFIPPLDLTRYAENNKFMYTVEDCIRQLHACPVQTMPMWMVLASFMAAQDSIIIIWTLVAGLQIDRDILHLFVAVMKLVHAPPSPIFVGND